MSDNSTLAENATPTGNMEGRLAYRPMEAAALLGVGRNRIFEWLKSGEIASVRRGKVRLIPKQALEQFLGLDQAA